MINHVNIHLEMSQFISWCSENVFNTNNYRYMNQAVDK